MTQASPQDPAAILEHTGWLRNLARQLVADPHTADDVVQSTLMAAMAWEGTPREGMRNWLAGVARNVVRQTYRGNSRRASRENKAAAPEAIPSSEEMVELVETQQWLSSAVLKLEEPYRTAIYLRYFEELSPKDIAASQGVPSSTVRIRIKRGLAQLRESLEKNNPDGELHWSLALVPLLRPTRGALLAPVAGSGTALTWLGALGSGPGPQALLLLGLALGIATLGLVLSGWFSSGTSEREALAPDQDLGALVDVGERRPASATQRIAPVEASGPAPTVLTAQQGFLVGRVLLEDQTPVVGAAVSAVEAHVRAPQALRYEDEEEFLASTRTDQNGIYRIPVKADHPHQVRVFQEGWAPLASPITFAGEVQKLILTAGYTTEIEISHHQGTGSLAGAKVRIHSVDGYRVPQAWSLSLTTDHAGRASIEHLPEGTSAYEIELAGYATVKGKITLDGQGPQRLSRTLAESVTVSGLVIERTTQSPLAGVLVKGPAGTTTTDHRGAFSLGGFDPQQSKPASVTVYATDFPPAAQYINIATAGERPYLTFKLKPWVSVTGRVLDHSGQPMAGLPVTFRGRFSPNPNRAERHDGSAQTDVDGRFELPLHYRAQYIIGAKGNGFAPASTRIRNFSPSRTAVDVGDLVLHPAGSLQGHVLQRTYDRERPDTIQLDLLHHGGFRAEPSLKIALIPVAPNGVFAVDDLSPGVYGLTLLGPKPNKQKGTVALVRKTIRVGSGEDITGITLSAVPPITGQVFLDDGQPAVRISVNLHRTADGPAIAFTRTDKLGNFALAPEGAGPFHLVVVDHGLLYGRQELGEVLPGSNGLRFDLQRRRTQYSIRGSIVNQRGNPVSGVQLRLVLDHDGSNLDCQAIMDGKGNFKFINLDEQIYSIHATDPEANFKFTSMYSIETNGDPVEFRLERQE